MSMMTAIARVPVSFAFDAETSDWHFVVDQHGWGVVGGGQPTLDEARRAAAEAIAAALETRGPRTEAGGRVEYLDIAVG